GGAGPDARIVQVDLRHSGRPVRMPPGAHEGAPAVPAEARGDLPAVAERLGPGVALGVEHFAELGRVGDALPPGGLRRRRGDPARLGVGLVLVLQGAEHVPGQVCQRGLDRGQRGQSDRGLRARRRTSPITRAAAATTAAPAMTAPATVAWRAARARVPWWASADATCSEVVQRWSRMLWTAQKVSSSSRTTVRGVVLTGPPPRRGDPRDSRGYRSRGSR